MDPVKEKATSSGRKLTRSIKKLIHLPIQSQPKEEGEDGKSRAAMEAFMAKLFAGVSSVKAAYAEFQLTQSPYDPAAIKLADEGVVKELKNLSDLKHSFLRNQIDPCPPHVTFMLAEIQEQQSLLKTYEITAKTLESRIRLQEAQIDLMKNQLEEIRVQNKSMEKKSKRMESSQHFTNIRLGDMNIAKFVQVLDHALKSVRHFVKHLVCSTENLHISSNSTQNDNELAFQSLVVMEMFESFDSPLFSFSNSAHSRRGYFRMFEKMNSENPRRLLRDDPGSPFANFLRSKYMKLIHPRMKISLDGKLTSDNALFVEMARWIWLVHCFAHCLEKNPSIFQVKKGSRFSQVFMECVNGDESILRVGVDNLRVAFTVAPGFQICRTIVQCQVFLSQQTTSFR